MRRFFIALVTVVLLAAAAGGVFLYGRQQLTAPATTHAHTVTLQVTTGETLDQVSDDLARKGLIRDRFWFSLFARYRSLGAHLRVGRYTLDTGMGASAIITKLEGNPDVATIRLVFTEGQTMRQMASVVAAAKGLHVTAAQYLAVAQNPSGFSEPFLNQVPAGKPLEGLLFPDTYDVAPDATAHDIIAMQLDDFQQRVVPQLTSAPGGVYHAVVVASIVEREAKFSADRPLVAGVIANRLAQGMNLQIDATVLYGLGITGRAPTSDELAIDTPYNSYMHSGLPPTPISNPGLSSLQAAASPAQTPYLFYVSDCDGHNHYAVTASDHEQQVAQYVRTC